MLKTTGKRQKRLQSDAKQPQRDTNLPQRDAKRPQKSVFQAPVGDLRPGERLKLHLILSTVLQFDVNSVIYSC